MFLKKTWLSFLHPVVLTIFWIRFYLPSSLPGTEREVVLLHRCVSVTPRHTVWAGGSSGGRQGPQPHPAVAQTPQWLLQQGGSESLLQQPPHLLAGVNRSHEVYNYVYIFIRKHTVASLSLLAFHLLLCPLFFLQPWWSPRHTWGLAECLQEAGQWHLPGGSGGNSLLT